MMKYIFATILISFSHLFLIGQRPFEIGNERFPMHFNKEKIHKAALAYVDRFDDLILIEDNLETGFILAKGQFKYVNRVESNKISNSKELNVLTNGHISYDLKIQITDSSYQFKFTNFKHNNMNNLDRYSLGLLTSSVEEYAESCKFNENWCKLVWRDMVENAKRELRIKQLRINF